MTKEDQPGALPSQEKIIFDTGWEVDPNYFYASPTIAKELARTWFFLYQAFQEGEQSIDNVPQKAIGFQITSEEFADLQAQEPTPEELATAQEIFDLFNRELEQNPVQTRQGPMPFTLEPDPGLVYEIACIFKLRFHNRCTHAYCVSTLARFTQLFRQAKAKQ